MEKKNPVCCWLSSFKLSLSTALIPRNDDLFSFSPNLTGEVSYFPYGHFRPTFVRFAARSRWLRCTAVLFSYRSYSGIVFALVKMVFIDEYDFWRKALMIFVLLVAGEIIKTITKQEIKAIKDTRGKKGSHWVNYDLLTGTEMTLTIKVCLAEAFIQPLLQQLQGFDIWTTYAVCLHLLEQLVIIILERTELLYDSLYLWMAKQAVQLCRAEYFTFSH